MKILTIATKPLRSGATVFAADAEVSPSLQKGSARACFRSSSGSE
jgi:hypothetical protein